MSNEFKTQSFKTQSCSVQQAIPSKPDRWPLALDIGYSSVKGMSPNKYFCFPAYAKEVDADRDSFRDTFKSDIRFRESMDSKTIWDVGDLAYAGIKEGDVTESEEELYGRKRYLAPSFKVLALTGIALGIMSNPFGKPENRKLMLQTGLPPKYMADRQYLKSAVSGHHEFYIKVGSSDWRHFDFYLDEDDVNVIPQPVGSLISVTVDADGRVVPESKAYRNSNLLIFDPGFGTTDIYTIIHGTVDSSETFPALGMHEVFKRTIRDIYDEFGVELSYSDLQNCQDDGTVTQLSVVDGRPRSEKKRFDEILKKNNADVCREALAKMNDLYEYLARYRYMIATGGTYDAWAPVVNDMFSEMKTLTIVPGNINVPDMPNIFSNVRGYYYYIANR